MRFDLKRAIVAGSACILLAGCGAVGGKNRPNATNDYPDPTRSEGGNAQMGMPDGDGQTAGAASSPQYDDVGYASWYGDELRGNPTALGEPFNPDAMSAAHPSLPLPSFVEVTHLGTGKTIIVRINDRGPNTGGRMIDLSRAAATELGGGQQGSFPVRVRRVNPPEDERSALAIGAKGASRLDTPEPLLIALRKKLGNGGPPVMAGPAPMRPSNPPVAQRPNQPGGWSRPGANYEQPNAPRGPAPQQQPSGEDGYILENAGSARPPVNPSTQSGSYFVQVAAFSSRQRADVAARSVGGTVQQAGNVWRVRKGPYPSEASARSAIGPIAAKGYRDARVTR